MDNAEAYHIEIIKESTSDFQNLLYFPIKENIVDKEGLAKAIAPVIGDLLNRDFEKLLQLCYRLDLGEKTLNRILLEAPPECVTADLSLAIVERQLLKVFYRKKYSNS